MTDVTLAGKITSIRVTFDPRPLTTRAAPGGQAGQPGQPGQPPGN